MVPVDLTLSRLKLSIQGQYDRAAEVAWKAKHRNMGQRRLTWRLLLHAHFRPDEPTAYLQLDWQSESCAATQRVNENEPRARCDDDSLPGRAFARRDTFGE